MLRMISDCERWVLYTQYFKSRLITSMIFKVIIQSSILVLIQFSRYTAVILKRYNCDVYFINEFMLQSFVLTNSLHSIYFYIESYRMRNPE